MICLVGDILTDVSLLTPTQKEYKMRLGGIVHAARGLWAMGVEYAVAFFAPAYLDKQLEFYLKEVGCAEIRKLGNVTGCPYTMLITEAREVGKQGYELLYRDCIHIDYNQEEINQIAKYDELLFVSGNYDLNLLLEKTRVGQLIHIDVANNIKELNQLPQDRRFKMLFVSTSSDLFLNSFHGIEDFYASLSPFSEIIVLKENRGGSRAYDTINNQRYRIPSQTSEIVHSVGVGDVFDAVSVAALFQALEERLVLASWISMCYAKTTFMDDFKRAVEGVKRIPINSLKRFEGCFLPWEARQNCHIYIAAPDFDYVDTTPIDNVCNSLSYHNFIAHRPIKENGQMNKDADKVERKKLYSADMELLNRCNMLVAVLLYYDPGTLIEIGMAIQKGLPTIVYDPYDMAENCMLTESPTLVSSDLDTIISKVFIEYSRLYKNGTL